MWKYSIVGMRKYSVVGMWKLTLRGADVILGSAGLEIYHKNMLVLKIDYLRSESL